MEYTVSQDSSLYDVQLYEGEVIYDGDLEPDVIAQLVSNGVLVSNEAPPKPEPKSKKH